MASRRTRLGFYAPTIGLSPLIGSSPKLSHLRWRRYIAFRVSIALCGSLTVYQACGYSSLWHILAAGVWPSGWRWNIRPSSLWHKTSLAIWGFDLVSGTICDTSLVELHVSSKGLVHEQIYIPWSGRKLFLRVGSQSSKPYFFTKHSVS